MIDFICMFAVLVAAPKAMQYLVYPLHFKGRLIIRQWISYRIQELSRWLDRKSDSVMPSASERARAGME
jgi:hypothetical protein